MIEDTCLFAAKEIDRSPRILDLEGLHTATPARDCVTQSTQAAIILAQESLNSELRLKRYDRIKF